MFSTGVLFVVVFLYISVLFAAAYIAERLEKKGRSIVSNPYIYALSLGVYCTSWTFYGSVGKAANAGLSFLTIYIGPTIAATLWWIVLRKMVVISKENRITTISDFIASRYGKSIGLSVLVTLVAVVGITPYLGLQLKAIMTTFSLLTGTAEDSRFSGWFIALVLGAFAVIFGARKIDASERHGGLVFAVAIESAIKLIAFLAVGFYVTYVLFGGFGEIYDKISASSYARLTRLGEGSAVSYLEWGSLTFLSMMAIMFLPRQFHVSVVENSAQEHIKKAMWLFPLYLFLMNIFVLPIAHGGLLLGGAKEEADFFVLSVPLAHGAPLLSLLAFIGGFSAATAMVIVESLALSTMVMHSWVMPALLGASTMKGFHQVILNIKRLVIIGCVFLGYIFAVKIGRFYSLVDIGLKSFEAVTIFAPSIILGLYWKGGNKKGAIAGISAGFCIWVYTLLVPALIRAGLFEDTAFAGIFESQFFNPTALFGLEGLDKWSHSLFWGLSLNLFFYVTVSLFTRQSEAETKQAMVFVDSMPPAQISASGRMPASVPEAVAEIEEILGSYIGPIEAKEAVNRFLSKHGLTRQTISREWLIKLKEEAETVLSGAVGPSISTLIFEEKTFLSPEEKLRISDSIRQMSTSLRLSRQELAEANRQLAFLKEFSESIIESIPLGVATFDDSLKIRYWNKAMEGIIKLDKADALSADVAVLSGYLEPSIVRGGKVVEGEFVCKRTSEPQMILKGHISALRGQQKGYVLVLEDITEKKRFEEELIRASKHASIGRLAAGVSHEIGNPLASISSLVQELMVEETTPFVKDSLEIISQHIDRIARIVRSLNEFARLYPRQKTYVSLSEVLEKTLNLIRYDKKFRPIKIKTDIAETPKIKIDPDQIQQVFLNLMLNARDSMPDGGVLYISIAPTDGNIQVIFKDTGSGIKAEHKDRLFEPFFTTKGPSRGTGLGLSICWSIIKDHGGTIEVESEEGKGTSFIIRLPVEEQ